MLCTELFPTEQTVSHQLNYNPHSTIIHHLITFIQNRFYFYKLFYTVIVVGVERSGQSCKHRTFSHLFNPCNGNGCSICVDYLDSTINKTFEKISLFTVSCKGDNYTHFTHRDTSTRFYIALNLFRAESDTKTVLNIKLRQIIKSTLRHIQIYTRNYYRNIKEKHFGF